MYVISFDVVGMVLGMVLLFLHIFLYDKSQKSNRLFRAYVMCAILECFLDLLTAKNIDGFIVLSDRSSIWFNNLFFFSTFFTAYIGLKMTSARMEYENRIVNGLVSVNFVLGILILIVNGFTPIVFTFENGKYIKTPYYIIIYIVSFIFLGLVPFIVWNKRKILRQEERLAPIFFLVALLASLIGQMAIPGVLLNGFGKSVSALIYCMLLDTPQHIKVRNAVEELKKAQEEELRVIDDLSRANDAKTDFLVKMTHELRTPINAILGFCEIIQRDFDISDIKDDVNELDKTGEHLIDLVDGIVDFSQIETGVLEIKPIEYEIPEAFILFRDILDKHESAYNQTIERKVTTDIPKRLYGDVKKVADICESLCDFLEKYSETSSLSLDVELDHIEHNKVFVKISIKNKAGISIEDIDNKMDIIIAKKLLSFMGSKLEYKHNVSENEFYFILEQEIVDLMPVGNMDEAVQRYEETRKKKVQSLSYIMPSANILVVDDTVINLKIIEGLLEPIKANVVSVTSGFEAIEYMKENPVDFVFMDILMPELDGTETLARIRADESIISKEAIVVALTANIFAGAKDFYLSKGFADYLTKPISGSVLMRVLKELMPEKIEENWTEFNITTSTAF